MAAFHFKCRARSWTDRRLERSKVTASAITRNPPTSARQVFVSVKVAQQAHVLANASPESALWIGCGHAADNYRGAGSGPRALAFLGRPALVDAEFSELFRDPIHSTLLTVELCYGGVTAIPAADLDRKGAVGELKDFILTVAQHRSVPPGSVSFHSPRLHARRRTRWRRSAGPSQPATPGRTGLSGKRGHNEKPRPMGSPGGASERMCRVGLRRTAGQ